MNTETPQLAVSREFDAPRALVFRAFTDPDHLAMWWGPRGNSLPRGEIEFDVPDTRDNVDRLDDRAVLAEHVHDNESIPGITTG